MLFYEALTKFDRGTVRLLFEDFALNTLNEENEEHALRDTRLRLSYVLCNIVDEFRVVEGVTNALALTPVDINEEDENLIEDLLTLYRNKYHYCGGREKSRNARLFLDIVYRRFDNLVLKYY